MRILFIGLGSIGVRNFEACKTIRPNYEYAALRSSKNKSSTNLNLEQFYTLEETQKFQPDLVWINTPTYLHASSLEQVIASPKAIFLEKPLAHTKNDLRKIQFFFQKTKKSFFYGCVFRHHPLILKVKQLLQMNTLGNPYSFQIYCGSYLPDWRQNQPYQESYSSKVEQGGGVTLDLIHEFDFAEFWFGPAKKITGFKTKVSNLDISSDDLCIAQLFCEPGIVGTIELNYFRKTPRRDFEIHCEGGTILGNLLNGSLVISSTQGKKEEYSLSIERNALYQEQAKMIFTCLEEAKESPWNIEEATMLNEKLIELPFLKI